MKELGMVAVMLTAQLLDVVVNTLSKAAMKKGMNNFVFVMYSNAFAACFIFLLALIFYRKRTLPPLSYNTLGLLFVVGLFSCSYQLLKYFGIGYSSPTLASALSDLVQPSPSYLPRSSGWKNWIGKLTAPGRSPLAHWALLLAASSCFLSINFVLVTRIIREYPSELMVVLIRMTLTSIFSVPAALISEKDLKAFRLGLNIELIAIGCSAIFVLSFRGVICTWAMRKKGPVYAALFSPLEIVFAVILGITFLGDSLYIGSVIGAAAVVIGFYAVILGKTQEKVEEDCTVYSSESYDSEAPLLQNKRMGD